MNTKTNGDPQIVLRNWRTRILNGFLAIAAVIAAVMTVATILDARSSPGLGPAVIVYLILTVIVAGLAVFRSVDYRVRAWCLLLLCYVAGLATLATFGLGSSGRLYLMAVPILALILIGARPGMALSALSILTLIAFAVLANRGILAEFLVRDRNSLLLADWLAEFADTLGILSVVMVLLILFYRFQERMIAEARRAQDELSRTQSLLEEQNATLEQKVQERTRELQASNHSLEQRNAALGILNSVSEAMTKTLELKAIMRLVGDKLREIFHVDSAMIMLLDTQTNLIHVPYEYDRREGGYIDYVEPFQLGTGLSSRVILTGQPLMAGTLEEEIENGAYFPPEIIEKGTGFYSQSWLGVPILSSDRVLGLVALADGQRQAFNPNHIRLLQTLSSNLGAAIENARLFAETERLLKETEQRNRELSIINNIQQGLVSQLDLQSLINLFGDELMRIFPPEERKAHHYSVYIALYDPQTDMIEFPYLIDGAGNRFAEPPTPLGPGLTSAVIRSGQALVLNTLEEQVAHGVITFTQAGVHIDSQSWLGVPIRSGDRVIGVISMQDQRPHLFTESMARLLSTLASSLGVALDNARLFGETQQRAAELAIINSVQAGLASKLDIQAIYELVGEKVRETFNAQVVSITTYDPGTQFMHSRYYFEAGQIQPGLSFPIFGFRQYVIEQRQPLLIRDDMPRWIEEYNNPIRVGAQPKSAIFIPMLMGDTAMGVISLQNNEQENAFSESDLHLLTTLANSMSVALENARLFDETQHLLEETRRAKETAETLRSANLALTQNLDLSAICEELLTLLSQIAPYDSATIFLLESNTRVVARATRGYDTWMKDPSPAQAAAFDVVPGTIMYHVVNGKSCLIDDTRLAQEWVGISGETYILSWLGVPMMIGNQIVGIISLDKNQANFFNKEMVELATSLGMQAAFAIQNARLYDETQRLLRETGQRAAELAIINSIQEGLASKLEMQGIYDLVGDKIREIFDAEFVALGTLDQVSRLACYHYVIQRGQRIKVEPIPYAGVAEHLIRTHQPLLFNQNATQQILELGGRYVEGVDSPQSALYVPLIVGAEVTGAIVLENMKHENAFSESDVRLLETLGNSMSVALENARLFAETQRLLKETEDRAAELAIINSVQAGLASKMDMRGIYDLVGDKIRDIFDADEVDIAMYDPATDLLTDCYSFEKGNRTVLSAPVVSYGFRKHVIETRQPLIINEDVEEMGRRMNSPVLMGQPAQSCIFVPLSVAGEVIGIISIQNMDRENAFTDSDVRLLQTLANSMSVALENARLFDETQRLLKETEQRAAELATVNTVSSALVSELDLGALLYLVGEQIRSIFKTDIAYVALLDRESNTINFPYQYGQHLEPLALGENLTSRIIQSGQPLLINEEMDRQRRDLGATLIGKRARSYLGVPIFVSGEAIGVVSVQSSTEEYIFTQNDQHLLSTIAANVGIALQNARLFDEVKRQEQVATETQRRLADIINFLPDATFVIDREGRVIAWNHAIEEMTGVTGQEMLGKADYEYALPFYGERRPILIDLVHLPHEDIQQKYAHIRWNRGILTGEAHVPSLRKEARYLYATASALYDAQGSFAGAIETIRDITDRKHTEEELVKARAYAEQANQAKSAFLANMSHELRTPLNAIIGFTRIVRRKAEGVLPEKQTENLDKVLTSADHLLNLINTVLDIAKIEAGRMDVLAANFRIGALIDLCANTVQPLLRPSVVLEKELDERLGIVHSDQDKIRQIVLNLLSNAAKFTHAGKVRLAAKQEGDNLHISVCDTGIGISAETLPRIFKEFQQADNTTTRQYGGTGLGLSISRNLARLLGGDINVESELGKGSTFTLVIPIQYKSKSLPPAEPPDSLAPQRDSASTPIPPPSPEAVSSKKRILVIDDDPDAAYLLQENLDPQEFHIVARLNGQDGLRAAREQHPDAILLDIVMPGTDGWQVLHDLKADSATSQIPVVMLTIVDNKALGFQLGAAAYLLKPLDAVEVRDTLYHVIGLTANRQKQVLVVDDDPNVVDMLRQSLPESDFCLEAAFDGQAGLRAIEAKPPDIVLLDLLMPVLDGFEVIERLRENPGTRNLPIIVISAKDLTAAESARLKETVSLVMKKQSFEGEKLVDEINHILSQVILARRALAGGESL